MADLIAQGITTQSRWRRTLPDSQQVLLGRTAEPWAVPWDAQISRRHAELCWRDGKLHVRRLPLARNPLFVRGRREDAFELRPGECFVSGETTFTVSDDEATARVETLAPLHEQTFRAQDLARVRFRDADRRLEILSVIPDVIARAASQPELLIQLGNMLLAGIAQADAVAVVAVDPPAAGAAEVRATAPVDILYWDRRLAFGENFRPSARLIQRAVASQASVSHVWRGDVTESVTAAENLDWAFCTPVRGKSCAGWALYVTGRFHGAAAANSDPSDLRSDIKFTELVAALLSSLQQVQLLERRQAFLSQFFSPSVVSTLGDKDAEQLLTPRETEVTVLFCDLRGFSTEADRHAADLFGLLQRVSKALGVMTRHILDNGGVVADFQGDAALGFWGWPLPQADAIGRACMAALGIRTQFEASARRASHSLAGFRMGIGIATGRAIAGKIGTTDQAKVGVFGPVVNLGSRLESMTKILKTPILLDETTARLARAQVSPRVARLRRLARLKPYGLVTPLTVSELLPPVDEYPELTDLHVARYEEALDALIAGRWPEAYELLRKVPPDDLAKDFLALYIAQHNHVSPAGWDGVLELQSKG